mgnify:CR=1 FL=1
MKQLGNLAVICAQRPELLMQLRGRSGLGTGEEPCGDGGRMER